MSKDGEPDHYAVLQVRQTAEQDVIEAAYARLGEMYAAQAAASPDAVERLARLNDAYAVIGDPARRAEYDAGRAAAVAAAAAQAGAPTTRPDAAQESPEVVRESLTSDRGVPVGVSGPSHEAAWERQYITPGTWYVLNGVLITGWLVIAITSGAVFFGVGAVVYAAVALSVQLPGPVDSSRVPEPLPPSPTASLQTHINYYVTRGYRVVSQTEGAAQLIRPKQISFGWGLFWFLFLGIGGMVYIFYHMSKKDSLIYLTVVDGEVHSA